MRVGVVPGTGVVVRRGATVVVIRTSGSPELAGRLIEAIDARTGADRLRTLARLALAEPEPPALAVATVDGDDVSVFLLGDLDLRWPGGQVSGAEHVLGATEQVPLAGGFSIVGAGEAVPELAAWNDLEAGSVRGDGVVVAAMAGAADEDPSVPDGVDEDPSAATDDEEEDPTGPMGVIEVDEAAAPPPAPSQPPSQSASPPLDDEVRPFSSVPLTPDADLSDREPLPLAGEPDGATAIDGPLYEQPVEVVGVYSPRGFFNHPDARYCSRTGVKMGASQTKVLTVGPRPPLGVITMDDGSTLTVQWNTVIGRDPQLDERVQRGEAAPFVVTDAGQSVSRRHAFIELVEWDVLVSDLGSRNRTWIQTSADEPRRPLAAGEHTVLRSGTIVHLGDRSFVYNEHHVR